MAAILVVGLPFSRKLQLWVAPKVGVLEVGICVFRGYLGFVSGIQSSAGMPRFCGRSCCADRDLVARGGFFAKTRDESSCVLIFGGFEVLGVSANAWRR